MKRQILSAILMLVLFHTLTFAQSQSNTDQPQNSNDGISLAPARFELEMAPGTEKTVVVNLLYNSASGQAQPTRLVSTLSDWSVKRDGRISYAPAGTQPNSACAWMIHSPAEMTAIPNQQNFIRVTISVPPDAKPGDHLAALFVERRPDNLKLEGNTKQIVVNFRMAAIFYIMVTPLSRKASLENLRATADKEGLTIMPTLKNEGNSRVRPVHSIKVYNSSGAVAVEVAENEAIPLIGNSELELPIRITKTLPPDTYRVQYRINFKDGSEITEGQTEIVIKD